MTAPANDNDFWEIAGQAIDTGLKLKKIMAKRNITRCKCVCPRCGGWIHAGVVGPKRHLRMACEGSCGMNMME